MENARISDFVVDRDRTFTAAVMEDDWGGFGRFLLRWGMWRPKDDKVMKAGVYKAVQECVKIPEEVKAVAREKCVAIGFKPTMW